MLGIWRSHDEYQSFVLEQLSAAAAVNLHSILEYEDEISKLLFLTLILLKISSLPSIPTRASLHTFSLNSFVPLSL